MTWLGSSQGFFRLHDSDRHCGSYFLVEDAAEILGTPCTALDGLPQEELDGVMVVSETVLRREWQGRRVASPHEPTIGGAKRSLDEWELGTGTRFREASGHRGIADRPRLRLRLSFPKRRTRW